MTTDDNFDDCSRRNDAPDLSTSEELLVVAWRLEGERLKDSSSNVFTDVNAACCTQFRKCYRNALNGTSSGRKNALVCRVVLNFHFNNFRKINMSLKLKMLALLSFAVIAGCASQQPAQNPAVAANDTATKDAAQKDIATKDATTKPQSAARPGTRIVKARNGNFDGEIIGTPDAKSKFSKLEIGMSRSEVSSKIGAPDDELRHETGKRWIPFYFGGDVQRVQVFYKGEGCLTFTGGNQFGAGGRKLIRIHVDPKNTCFTG